MGACELRMPNMIACVGEDGKGSPRIVTQKLMAALHSGCALWHSIMCSWLSSLHPHPSLHDLFGSLGKRLTHRILSRNLEFDSFSKSHSWAGYICFVLLREYSSISVTHGDSCNR